jgi:hypothetical protein
MGLHTHLNAMTAHAPGVLGALICGRDRIVTARRAGHDVDMASKPEQISTAIGPPVGPDPTNELDLIERASMLDDGVAINGGAGVGWIVKVADRAGRTTEYELVGPTEGEPVREHVSLASATGKALLGARPGDRVRVTHANGRQRRVRVVNVKPALTAGLRASDRGR